MSANHLLRCSECSLVAAPAEWHCSSCEGLLRIEWTSAPGRERVGAEIVLVDGPRSAVTEAALAEVARSGAYYAGHNANPYFAAGMATFAYELIEQLGTDLPRHLVFPTGGGSLVVGAYAGFR